MLANHTCFATFAIDNELNSNIVMNGGTLYFAQNLALKDDIKITGSGTIYFYQHNLDLGTSDLVW
ncbi:MAG: hypothetical protein C0412_18595, partial [Flavobacterium sp.]|nr:hypothetical protein [Flavobacterium sp.]